jgi:hypothetical protein
MRMTHQEIEDNEIVERYVCHRLSADERRAFQEHFFACDGCFDKVQMTARFIAGVRDASVAGVLAQGATAPQATAAAGAWWTNWLKPAFVVATAASVLLAVLLGWLLLNQIPRLRGDVERERGARQQVEREQQELEREKQQALDGLQNELAKEREQLEQERTERAKLQKQLEELAHNRLPSESNATNRTQANAPIVILEALRDSQTGNELELPANARSATLWIEVEPGNRFTNFSLQLITREGHVVTTVSGAKKNSYGAVAVNLTAKILRVGNYVVKLYGLGNNKSELVGEYDLRVRKP